MLQRVEDLLDQRQLALELVGRLVALGLVLGVLLEPEGLAGDVEGDRDVGGLLVAQHVDEHRGEAVDGVGVLPGRRGEVLHRQREERAVGQRVAVEQQQARAGGVVGAGASSGTARLYPAPPTRPAVGNNGAMTRPTTIDRHRPRRHDRRRVHRLDAAGHGQPQRADGHRARRDLRRAGRRRPCRSRATPSPTACSTAARRWCWPRRSARSARRCTRTRTGCRSASTSTPPTTASATSGTVTGSRRRSTSAAAAATYEVVITDEQGRAGVHVADHLRAHPPRNSPLSDPGASQLRTSLSGDGWRLRIDRRAASTWVS